MSLVIPQELDPMAALQALVDQSPLAQKQAAQPTQPIPKEDVPQTTPIIPDKDYSGPSRPDGATIAQNDPLFISPAPPAKDATGASVPSPIPQGGGLLGAAPTGNPAAATPSNDAAGFSAVVPISSTRFCFTGRTGTGKDWLAQQAKLKVLDVNAPLLEWAKEYFPNAKMPDLIPTLQTIKAWGNGVVDKSFPITPTRWMFLRWAQSQSWSGPGNVAFGTPGFWMSLLIMSANATDQPVAVTNIQSVEDYRALKAAGFTHFHVMTSPAEYMRRTKRQGADDRLSTALDQDAIKKVSAQRQGDKLPVIWNAPELPPSPRIWTVAEFLQTVNAAPVEQIAAFE